MKYKEPTPDNTYTVEFDKKNTEMLLADIMNPESHEDIQTFPCLIQSADKSNGIWVVLKFKRLVGVKS